MNNQNQNSNQFPKEPLPEWAYQTILGTYIAINGMVTGNGIRMIRRLANEQGDEKSNILILLISIAMVLYTGNRAYNVYKEQQSRKNQKQK